MRSMIHVDDVVNAIHLVMTKVEAHNETFIVTDNNAYSTRMIYGQYAIQLIKNQQNLVFIKYFTKFFLYYFLL